MSRPTFEAALEACLYLLDAGEATVEACAARYPDHEDALRRALALRVSLGAGAPVPAAAAQRGWSRLRAALIAGPPSDGGVLTGREASQ